MNTRFESIFVENTAFGCTQQISALMSLREKISRDLGKVTIRMTELKEEMDAFNPNITSLEDQKAPQHLCKVRQTPHIYM